jgi:hypothetical protein
VGLELLKDSTNAAVLLNQAVDHRHHLGADRAADYSVE